MIIKNKAEKAQIQHQFKVWKLTNKLTNKIIVEKTGCKNSDIVNPFSENYNLDLEKINGIIAKIDPNRQIVKFNKTFILTSK